MKTIDAQTHLRQQLGFARFYLSIAENADSLHAKRSVVQAIVFCLEEGVRAYCDDVLHLSTLRLSQMIATCIKTGSSSDNFKQQELVSLATSDESWLVLLAHLRDSVGMLSSEPGALPASTLIATSNTNTPHWLNVDTETLSALIDAISELLVRHSDTDIEY